MESSSRLFSDWRSWNLVISWFGDRFRNNNIEGIRSDLQIIVGSILGLVKVLGGDDFDFFIFIVVINFFYFVLVRTSIGSMNFVGLLIVGGSFNFLNNIVIVIVLVLALIYRKLSLSNYQVLTRKLSITQDNLIFQYLNKISTKRKFCFEKFNIYKKQIRCL
jgi:hypothetical protein